jgi:type I restriction enzyme S subunit
MATKRVKIPFEIEIPAHWKAVTNRGIFKEYNVRGMDQLQLLSVSQKDGVVLQTEITTKKDTSNDNKTNYKHVMSGDIVYNKMRMWQGAVGVSKYEGIVSPAYVILRAIRGDIDPDYFHYQYRTKFYIKQSGIYSYGLCDDMNSLRYEDFKNMKSILPPIDDQKDIVIRIKHYNEAINEFIRKKERYIELLKEYKQSKINELVTKGLDPNVKMKDSGIAWLGEIPQHWEVKRLKNLVDYCNRGETPKYIDESPVKVVNQATFSKGEFCEKDIKYHDGEAVKGALINGDLLLASTGGGVLGKVYLFQEGDGYMADSHVTIIRSKEMNVSKYLYYFFRGNFSLINGILAEGSTNQTELQRDWLRSMYILRPPRNEMDDILHKIEEYDGVFEKIVDTSQKQILAIRKYRQSLIYELVTGIRKP